MYDKCYFCLDQLPKLKKESTASSFVNFGGARVQKSRPTLLYNTPSLKCVTIVAVSQNYFASLKPLQKGAISWHLSLLSRSML